MSNSDFIREVDDAVRKERYRLLWDRYGLYVIGLAAAFIIAVGAYKGWQYWTEQGAAQAGAEFTEALTQARAGAFDKADQTLQRLAKNGPGGYHALARLQLASDQVKQGKTDQAITTYDGIANDGHIDPIFRDDAAIQAATLRLPKADMAEMQRRLMNLATPGNPWKYSAEELLGLAAYRLNDIPAAKKQFSALLADRGTPQNMRERASMMLALIMGSPQTTGKESADKKTD